MCTSTAEAAAALPVQPETVIADSTVPGSGIAVGAPLLIVHVPAAAADAIAFDAGATEITCGSAASRCACARVSLWFGVAEAEAVAASRPIAARPAARVRSRVMGAAHQSPLTPDGRPADGARQPITNGIPT